VKTETETESDARPIVARPMDVVSAETGERGDETSAKRGDKEAHARQGAVGEHEARLRQLLGLGGFARPAVADLFA